MFLPFWTISKRSGRTASPLETPVWPPFILCTLPSDARSRAQVEECQRLLAVPTKRGPTRAVDYLEGDEIGAMLEAASAHRQDHIRDRALLLTLFNTGARVQELLDIRPGDLQLDRPTFSPSPRQGMSFILHLLPSSQ